MPVVTTTFSTTSGQVWASPTWSSSDPSKKVHDQLSAWVNAINDPTKIQLIHSPGDATSRASGQTVRWLLRAREAETSSDYGFSFIAGATATSGNGDNGAYYSRTAGSSNNGSGSYSLISTTDSFPIASYDTSHYVAYRADGLTPWFLYANKFQIGVTAYGSLHLLMRVSTADMAAGSYYPATGLGKWIYAIRTQASFGAQIPLIFTPQASIAAPYYGITQANVQMRFPAPALTFGDGYFFRFGAQYGATHYIGAPNYDDFLVSNANTGVWGDTVVINSVTYTRVGPCPFWVRSS